MTGFPGFLSANVGLKELQNNKLPILVASHEGGFHSSIRHGICFAG